MGSLPDFPAVITLIIYLLFSLCNGRTFPKNRCDFVFAFVIITVERQAICTMNKILFINACVRPNSRTKQLAECVLNRLNGSIEEVNLERENIQPLNWTSLQARDALVQAQDFSAPMFRYARQFAAANEIVIAAPYWDLAFPSSVKVYFEAVTVLGLTFRYTPEGIPAGLCQAKRILYVTTAGGPVNGLGMGYAYVKALAQTFYGIPEILGFKAENLDIVGADVAAILEKAKQEIARSAL